MPEARRDMAQTHPSTGVELGRKVVPTGFGQISRGREGTLDINMGGSSWSNLLELTLTTLAHCHQGVGVVNLGVLPEICLIC